eukprot:CAMPEP_0180661542 /NCGR_PEP_ID=MMETSP1037_2-20121125/58898_1 /TAXON_ID=632150 /ORGANISM="Azadinium spinosum, Strain 3D9" /LENGTH=207 /DNA_ID=CAMNT_0022689113 /DNA_START=37 /DNA_END=661 /DNA_ORIENTATION=+
MAEPIIHGFVRDSGALRTPSHLKNDALQAAHLGRMGLLTSSSLAVMSLGMSKGCASSCRRILTANANDSSACSVRASPACLRASEEMTASRTRDASRSMLLVISKFIALAILNVGSQTLPQKSSRQGMRTMRGSIAASCPRAWTSSSLASVLFCLSGDAGSPEIPKKPRQEDTNALYTPVYDEVARLAVLMFGMSTSPKLHKTVAPN